MEWHAVVGHDTHIRDMQTRDMQTRDFVSVTPNATISSECSVGADVFVGANSVDLQGLIIGAGATTGAAAGVNKWVVAGAMVVGTPTGTQSSTGGAAWLKL